MSEIEEGGRLACLLEVAKNFAKSGDPHSLRECMESLSAGDLGIDPLATFDSSDIVYHEIYEDKRLSIGRTD